MVRSIAGLGPKRILSRPSRTASRQRIPGTRAMPTPAMAAPHATSRSLTPRRGPCRPVAPTQPHIRSARMQLYFAPRTRASRPRWLLEELEVPYELVKLDLSKQESRTPAYLALHPFGEVPVLVDGDVTLFESSAICLYLADRFPEKRLAPSLGSPD